MIAVKCNPYLRKGPLTLITDGEKNFSRGRNWGIIACEICVNFTRSTSHFGRGIDPTLVEKVIYDNGSSITNST